MKCGKEFRQTILKQASVFSTDKSIHQMDNCTEMLNLQYLASVTCNNHFCTKNIAIIMQSAVIDVLKICTILHKCNLNKFKV